MHLLYIPGLGDDNFGGQKQVVQWWRLYGITGRYMPMHWADGQPLEAKLTTVLDAIDKLSTASNEIVLIGASAGASVALLAYAERRKQVAAVVCICGKINHPQTVRPAVYSRNPAFKQAMQRLQSILPSLTDDDRRRVLSLHALHDTVVPVPDTIIPGAQHGAIWAVGHALGIIHSLLFGVPRIKRFVRCVVANA